MQSTDSLRMMVMASLFAALIAAGAFLAIPVGPVPIYLANFFVMLAGLVLGPQWGSAAVGAYLLAGTLGLPVFAGGTGGIGRFFGPTGGYLLAYLPAVFLAGVISKRTKPSPAGDVMAMLAAVTVIYGMGVPWLKTITGMTWGKSLAVGMVPFLIGDGIKIAAAIPVVRMVRPLICSSDKAQMEMSPHPNVTVSHDHH
ncbi:MAG: biotin transporter BioY [Thermodesulfobacteriota bacterium]|nr:biotin transporter BioY [Thermodesulfobacteriota bacterium]